MLNPIAITSISSISPLGITSAETWNNYLNPHHFIRERIFGDIPALAASISDSNKTTVTALGKKQPQYKDIDLSVTYAILAARNVLKNTQWTKEDGFGINIGSSRGATMLFERYYDTFLKHGTATPLTSPTTTLGNISSWVAHDLQSDGPEISHSITCSTALHALLNGVAWLHSGLAEKFLVGGSEAPLTPFTIAQMRALRIYASSSAMKCSEETPENNALQTTVYPCRALDLDKKQNTMVLGEGSGMACLEIDSSSALAYITGIGYATEMLKHNVSISAEAACLQRSMKNALAHISPSMVDVVVMHAPGTVKGDQAEYNALKTIFGHTLPSLTTNKWKIGHTFGASGILSVELAVLMLQHQHFVQVPFIPKQPIPKRINHILVNAVGFGGNAVSVLLSRSR